MSRSSVLRLAFASISILGFACSAKDVTQDSGPPSVGGDPLPCAVDAVIDANCRQCHSSPPKFGAPMALITSGDMNVAAHTDHAKKVYELVGTRIHDDAKPMPQAPNPRLSAGDTKIIDDWIAAGAPAGTVACASSADGGGGDSGTSPLACDVHDTLVSTSPWEMPMTTEDEYVCYGFDVTVAQKRHVVAMGPNIDNSKIVHHALLFQAPNTVSGVPAPCQSGGGVGWRILFGWAPGGKNIELPPEAGFPEEKTTHYVVQVHYNNVNHLVGEKDSSGFTLCTTDQLRPNDADVMAFGSEKFTIPAQSKKDMTCSITVPSQYNGLHLFSSLPHMHKIGSVIATTNGAADLGT
ncbi:MAG: peptidylglycine alpha-amidating monooxygenase, partial [Polyangiaceae bacterium]